MKPITCLTAAALLLALAGCTRFTRANFDMIEPGVDTKFDVERMLGAPEFNTTDEWYYENMDEHYAARIFFDARGRVRSKQWIAARSGEWTGENPDADPEPDEPVRYRRDEMRTIDD